MRLRFLRPRFLDVLRATYLLLRSGTRLPVRLEDKMLFEDGLGLHGGNSGEDVEHLVVAYGGHLAEEKELVHRVLWEKLLGLLAQLCNMARVVWHVACGHCYGSGREGLSFPVEAMWRVIGCLDGCTISNPSLSYEEGRVFVLLRSR